MLSTIIFTRGWSWNFLQAANSALIEKSSIRIDVRTIREQSLGVANELNNNQKQHMPSASKSETLTCWAFVMLCCIPVLPACLAQNCHPWLQSPATSHLPGPKKAFPDSCTFRWMAQETTMMSTKWCTLLGSTKEAKQQQQWANVTGKMNESEGKCSQFGVQEYIVRVVREYQIQAGVKWTLLVHCTPKSESLA